MSVPGEDILAKIEDAAARLREDARRTAERRDEAESDRARRAEQRDEVLASLARVSLPSLDAGDIEKTHAGLRRELRDLAGRRQRTETELKERRHRLSEEFERRDALVRQALAAEREASAAYDARREELERSLEEDADYAAMKSRTEAARLRLERDARRLAEVEEDAAEKLPEYEASPLFTYLRDRRYGTADARGGPITRRIDDRVAAHIDYATLAEGYRFLTDVPALMRDELDRRRKELDDQIDQMLARVRSAETTFGLSPLESAAEEASRSVKRAREDRDRTVEHLETVDTQLADVRSNECRFYAEALASVGRYLSGLETSVLADRAAETETMADDDAVAELRRLREEDAADAAELKAAEDDAARFGDLASGLDYVLRRARQGDLGSGRASFPDHFDVTEPLRQYEKSVIDRSRLLDILRDTAEVEPTWAERAYRRGGDLASSPTAQVLLGTAAAAGRKALEEAMRRR